ncbi:hypothetical protein SAMN05216466_106102 [Paraburkholderia phenazinium]|uniref:Uncharacterized protein n=1 Tax=Paraburkholderia phenazinium TaxID=60549 RepID=A0A1G7YAF3_9BURK|nr:hypothetical protein [Paraburkholderia phenazinium]SDG93327.1 hypothetical protein SAMN05216466_106102 [Paraburkholderia phenazinium]
MAFARILKIIGKLRGRTAPDDWTDEDLVLPVIPPPGAWMDALDLVVNPTFRAQPDDTTDRDVIRQRLAQRLFLLDWERAIAEGALWQVVHEAIRLRGTGKVSSLVNATNADDVLRLAQETQRPDVMALTIPHVEKPVRLLKEPIVMLDDGCLGAVLARLSEDDLNAIATINGREMTRWEVAIDLHRQIPQQRFIDVILPKMHAAGADVMDDRFTDFETPGFSALAIYRRRTSSVAEILA